jgi:uncharacterized protein DUF4232
MGSRRALSVLPVLAVLGAACSTSSSTSTVTVTKTRTVTKTLTVTTSRCRTNQLGFTYSTNGATGSILIVGTFVNHGQTACSLVGYPGLGLVGKDGSSLPASVVRSRGSVLPPNVPEHTVVLKPGGAAQFFASFSNVGNSPCPVAAKLQVTPPNAYTHVTVGFGFSPCQEGRLHVSPVFTPGASSP